jgi:signal transduction histidine kinase
MSKPLLQRNTRYLLTWLPVVLLVCSFAFYVMLRMQGHHMQEKQLLLKQRNVWTSFISKEGSIEKHIAGEYDIDEISNNNNTTALNEPRDTSIYYADKQKSLPFEILTSNVAWHAKTYQLTTYVSSTEISHLIIKVFLAELVILLLLLIAIVFLNRKSSGILWQPFFSSLDKLKDYDIKKNQALELPQETGTTEFNQLNRTATGLIGNSNTAYYQQKQFVENASHEIQTPLAIIRSKLELLINEPNLTEKQASLLGDITDANERLSLMNRTLLLLAKIENNQFPETEAVNISNSVEQLIETFKNHYDNFPELVSDIKNNVSLTANRALIEILLSNLITNAIVHNIPGGKMMVGLAQSGFSIENTGPPLDTTAEELFDRFKKGSHSTKTTGLGLAIVRQICTLYHYRVSYQFDNGWHRVMVTFG